MNNIIKNQSTPTTTWGHRKTIQSQKQRIEELEKELDLRIARLAIVNEDLRRSDEKLRHKDGLFRIQQDELKLMDEKLLDAQDEFFNLGDACMGRIAGLESPFQYE